MMNASMNEHPYAAQPQRDERPLAQSVFSGEARLRELEHLADTARKIRDQAAAELTRGSGAAHHIARERISIAERMLRKTQLEIAELRDQLNTPSGIRNTTPASTTAKDNELAILLGHSTGRFNQVGGAHAPLSLQQEDGHNRQYSAASHPHHSSGTASHKTSTPVSSAVIGTLVIFGLGVGALALGILAMLN